MRLDQELLSLLNQEPHAKLDLYGMKQLIERSIDDGKAPF
jgi:hypothetical protein